ncbi:MAG: xylulokinase, partial [Clostridia bacterium]|nr:xylulokinase [Clostridia bacterium]
ALLAMVGCGEYATVKDACDACVAVRATILPDEKLTKAYDKAYKVYKELYPAMKNVFKLMK